MLCNLNDVHERYGDRSTELNNCSEDDRLIIEACNSVEELNLSAVLTFVEQIGARRWSGFLDRVIRLKIRVPAAVLLKLVKLRTIHELGSSRLNSATLVPQLIDRLRMYSPELASELEIWAFHSTTNPYVPFGTLNGCRLQAISVAEYHQLICERDATNAAIENQKLELAKKLRAERASKHELRMAAQKERNAERNRLVEKLNEMFDPIQRLSFIGREAAHPPFYFPETFAEINAPLLSELSSEAAISLVEKLKYCPRGEWRKLRQRLLQILRDR